MGKRRYTETVIVKEKHFRKGGGSMSYSTVEKQIHSVPEEYMDEVADFLDYLMYKIKRKEDKQHTSSFFGSITRPIDGLSVQRSTRDEWD